MSQLSQPQTVTEPKMHRVDGVKRLRVACLTLMRTLPDQVRSMSVIVPLDSIPISATSAVDLAEHVSAEYGLIVKTELDGPNLMVRLVRSVGRDGALKHS